MDSPGRSRLHFGPFEFDSAAGELYRDGTPVRLQEKPRQLLEALLERPGEILSRETLRERLWAADTFVDFEHGLNTAIKKVRQALGDSAETPRFVETLARRGYRFIAPVTVAEFLPAVPAASVPESAAAAPRSDAETQKTPHEHRSLPAGPPARQRPRRGFVVTAIGLMLTAGAGVWFVQRPRSARTPAVSRDSTTQLAVMPLRVLAGSGPGDVPHLGVGIADAITTRLANTRQLALRPTWAVLPYKDSQSDPIHLAAALGVQHLLLGTVQPAERTYRVSVQLVGADGVAVWGRTYDEAHGGLLEVQDHIAEQIVAALRVELSPPERARLHLHYTQNTAAYDLYLRGRTLLVNYTEANMREALEYFEQALALDQGYALARTGLATAAAWFSVRYAYEAEALAWGKRADEEARRALAQDPSLADAHLAIASAAGTLYGGFDWKVVLERTAAALSLDPSLDLAHIVRMRAFYHLGRFDDVRRAAQLARAINPAPSVEASRLEVAANLFGGRFTLAAEQATALLPQSDAPAIRHYLGLARYYTGDVAGARDILASARRGGQPDVRSQASLASIEAATGLKNDARARAAAVTRGSYMDHHVAYSLGATFAQLGDVDAAVTWLQRAADSGFPCYPWFEQDTLLAPLRGRPEFARLLERLRGTYERSGASTK